jgi:hypothetical protein
MSADPLSEILAELGRGDEVAVAERLKTVAFELGALLDDLPDEDGQLTDERVSELLDATSAPGEAFLTVAVPVVEYGRAAALEALPRALRYVTRATAAARTDQNARRVAAVPAVGRLVWALAAFALHCDRPEALVALGRARVTVPFSDGDVAPVMALTALRYPDALGGNAGNSFRDYHDWLAARPLLQRYPLFAAELDAALLEADLVLGMYAGRLRSRVYSTGHDRDTARRFVARLEDAAQREALERLFPGEGSLEERLEHAYAATEGDRNRFERGPAQLFGDEH